MLLFPFLRKSINLVRLFVVTPEVIAFIMLIITSFEYTLSLSLSSFEVFSFIKEVKSVVVSIVLSLITRG